MLSPLQKLKYYLIYKPKGILCQFGQNNESNTLKSLYGFPNDVYSIGRLDKDSEGLLIITNDKYLQTHLLNPQKKHYRTYWVLVKGKPTQKQLNALQQGLYINVKGQQYKTQTCTASLLNPSQVYQSLNQKFSPQAMQNKSWISIKLTEGKNRQVRKMTAKIGHPTLQLIRYSIELLTIDDLKIGQVIELDRKAIYKGLKFLK